MDNSSINHFDWTLAHRLYVVAFLVLRRQYKRPLSPRKWCRFDQACPVLHAALRLRIWHWVIINDPHRSLDRDDLLEDAWERMHDHWKNGERFRHVYALVDLLAEHVVIDAMRKHLADKRGGGQPMLPYAEVDADDSTPARTLDLAQSCAPQVHFTESEVREQVNQLVLEGAITANQGVAFVSLRLEELTWEDIAVRTGSSRATVFRDAAKVQQLIRPRFS